MRNILTEIKINTKAITEEGFKFKMDSVPAYYWLKTYQDKIYCEDLAVYISKEDAEKLGFQRLVDITKEYADVIEKNLFG